MAGRVLRRLAVASGLAVLLVVPTWGRGSVYQNAPYRRGDTISIEGTVADSAGAPVEGVTVVLSAAHRAFVLRGMRHVEEGLRRVTATTDAEGRFAIPWTWHPYYDVFRIRADWTAAAVAAAGGGSSAAVLTEVDLTRRIGEGSPVVVALEVAAAEPQGAYGALTAASASDDQRRVFEEMGKPDRVDRLETPVGVEVAWWYFERGKSFHFLDGLLDQESEFEPVTGF
jgi:hypothetical protein